MDRNSPYYKQVQWLIQLLPLVAEEGCFALKGGTAINLFVRDLPRLSVDIDLVYLPMKARNEALNDIRLALERILQRIEGAFSDAKVIPSFKNKEDALRLVVSRQGVQVKIELSPVLRGTVFEPKVSGVRELVEDEFGYAEIAVVDLADLYAGKICAALDRQHPRDLFDVKWLLDNEGLTEDIRRAFVVYLISHGRPMAELLNPKHKHIKQLYDGEFSTMAAVTVSYEELIATRERLITLIQAQLSEDEKRFLLSFKSGAPQWQLLGLEGVEKLPAVKWKLINIGKMSKAKQQQAYDKLAKVLQQKVVLERV